MRSLAKINDRQSPAIPLVIGRGVLPCHPIPERTTIIRVCTYIAMVMQSRFNFTNLRNRVLRWGGGLDEYPTGRRLLPLIARISGLVNIRVIIGHRKRNSVGGFSSLFLTGLTLPNPSFLSYL